MLRENDTKLEFTPIDAGLFALKHQKSAKIHFEEKCFGEIFASSYKLVWNLNIYINLKEFHKIGYNDKKPSWVDPDISLPFKFGQIW